jgi:hypothetical protein
MYPALFSKLSASSFFKGFHPFYEKHTNRPGVSIDQTGNNKNIAIGSNGNDQIRQTGIGSLMFALGLNGRDRFEVNGQDNVGALRGGNGNDTFKINAESGFYKVSGGGGFDTLSLAGEANDWKRSGHTLHNESTGTTVIASGIERIVCTLA